MCPRVYWALLLFWTRWRLLKCQPRTFKWPILHREFHLELNGCEARWERVWWVCVGSHLSSYSYMNRSFSDTQQKWPPLVRRACTRHPRICGSTGMVMIALWMPLHLPADVGCTAVSVAPDIWDNLPGPYCATNTSCTCLSGLHTWVAFGFICQLLSSG